MSKSAVRTKRAAKAPSQRRRAKARNDGGAPARKARTQGVLAQKAPLAAPAARRVPLALKIAYTAFMAVLIPVYWANYGPTNFLYFCDLALLLTLAGVWLESPLLVSAPAVGIIAPQILWIVDFGSNLFGHPLTGMTNYMFNHEASQFLRGLSLFHGWLPILLAYLVWRMGYDKRALALWTSIAWAAMLIAYFFLPGPNPNPGLTPVNVNYVFGMSDNAAQTWMPGWAWLTLLLVGLPAFIFTPTHFVLKWAFGKAPK
jgi:hypothetical protein